MAWAKPGTTVVALFTSVSSARCPLQDVDARRNNSPRRDVYRDRPRRSRSPPWNRDGAPRGSDFDPGWRQRERSRSRERPPSSRWGTEEGSATSTTRQRGDSPPSYRGNGNRSVDDWRGHGSYDRDRDRYRDDWRARRTDDRDRDDWRRSSDDRDLGRGRLESRPDRGDGSGQNPTSQQHQIREFRCTSQWRAGNRPPVDWVCNASGCVGVFNFSRRNTCISCGAPFAIAGAPVDGEKSSVALPYSFDTPVAVGAGGVGSGGLMAHVPSRVLVVRGRAQALDHTTVRRLACESFLSCRVVSLQFPFPLSSQVTDAFRAFGPLERVFAPPIPPTLLRCDGDAALQDAASSEGVPSPWGRLWVALAVYPTVDIARHALVQCNAWGPGTEEARRMSSRAVAECAELFLSGVGCVELKYQQPLSAGTPGGGSGSALSALCEVTFARANAIETLTAQIEAARVASAATAASAVAPSLKSNPITAARAHVLVPATLPPLVGVVVPRLPLPVEQFQATHYAFDARSGLFYEASRMFYYDAASGLYLDTKTWSYLRRDDNAEDKFSPWTPPLPTQPPPIIPAPAVAGVNTGGLTPEVASTSAVAASVACIAGPVSNPLLNDSTSISVSGTDSLPRRVVDSPIVVRDNVAEGAIKPTDAITRPGVAFACELCRRGFASADQLRKHELKSELHRQNLAAAGANAGITG